MIILFENSFRTFLLSGIVISIRLNTPDSTAPSTVILLSPVLDVSLLLPLMGINTALPREVPSADGIRSPRSADRVVFLPLRTRLFSPIARVALLSTFAMAFTTGMPTRPVT